jgi:hypothetical protein
MGHVIDVSSCDLEPRTEDLDQFIGSNEEFGLAHLPQLRAALIACHYDDSQLAKVVRELAADSLVPEVVAQWRETANYFADLTKALETAIGRVTDIARETEHAKLSH